MRFVFSINDYKGTDGSSLSDTRCEQLLQLFNMLSDMPLNTPVTYKHIQDEAARRSLYGNAKAQSVIRTFFPLLCKLGFVTMDDLIMPDKVFTNSGIQLALLEKALLQAQEINNPEIVRRLYSVKAQLIQKGILFWKQNDQEHNIWIAFRLLREFYEINWDEFLIAIYYFNRLPSFEDVIKKLKEIRTSYSTFEFVKEDGKELPDTTYTYIRGLLNEAQIITNIDSNRSILTSEGHNFINTLF